MKNHADLIKVSDLYVIAYLMGNGIRYYSIDRLSSGSKGKVYFYFSLDAQNTIDNYFNGQEISAIAFKNAIENVKSLIFDF